MIAVTKLQQLKELSLDGNPVLSSEDCIFFVVTRIPSVQIFGQTKITDDIKKVAKVWQLRKEFNEKPSASFDIDRLRAPTDEDLDRTRSASENRISHLRKRNANSKFKEENTNPPTKFANRYGSCSAKPNQILEKNAKNRRADYSKRKNVSFESCNGSETSIEYFRLPPILTSSLNSADDCNVVIRNDPNTSMESNKSYCTARCESAFSVDKTEDSTSDSESETESSRDSGVQNIRTNIVPPIQYTESPQIAEKDRSKETPAEIRTPLIGDTKTTRPTKITTRVEKVKEQGLHTLYC